MTQPSYAKDAFDLIDRLDRLSDTDAVMDAMQRAVAGYGFETLLFTGRPNPEQRFDNLALVGRWPAEWFKIYNERRYIHVDPVVRHLRRSVKPFAWTDARYDPEAEPRAAELMQLRADFGFGRALVVPIPGPAGSTAGISMIGRGPDLTVQSRPTIHLMALYAFDRAASLRVTPHPKPFLTAREREVLSWVAAGKSAWDIGEELNIAKRTVDAYAQTATRKLGAATRTQAVALAIRDRFISV
ncbi:MAG: LuxR family transcriptional regulator, quorum-sensing system regulator BjaR1 [Hyphomicrobiales bacterium]